MTVTFAKTMRCLLGLSLFGAAATAFAMPAAHPGAAIYEQKCASCHGKQGEGVKDEYDEPLVGDRSLEALTRKIKRTMPEEDPGSLTDEQAAQVSAYIYEAFYSPAAQARLNPPGIELARLTVPQYRASVADVVGRFRGGFRTVPENERGLRARYSGFSLPKLGPEPMPANEEEKKKREKEKKERERVKFDRVEPQVAVAFGADSPEPQWFAPDEFQARWEGSIYARDSGTYEFIVKTENGVRLWVNDRKNLLIDAWVTPGPQVREERKSVYLVGGRYYPLVLEFFKYRDKTASVELLWKPPYGVEERIPERCLSPHQVPTSAIVSTPFPADDRSVGYERGTGLSKEWQQAIMRAAIEVAEHVEAHLDDLAQVKKDAPERTEKVRTFAQSFVETAFRRPLDDEQRKLIDELFSSAKSPEVGIRRVVLYALKSPRFLYPILPAGEKVDDYDVASRLALAIWDSVPDDKLLKAAAEGKLRTREEIAEEIKRMLADGRTKAKVHGFFHHWLEMDRGASVAKDAQAFPGFDESVLADLRTSLALFLDEVVWSERSDYRSLLQADYLWLNSRLAKFYGVKVTGEGFEKVTFDRKQRAGVVTHPYMMTTLAHNKYTSPIHRGVFLTRNVLGITLKSPPDAVAFEDSKFDPTLTMREKVTELTRDQSCMSCHAVINPLGFALEHYDATGRWRTEDNSKPVDSRGEIQTDEGETVRFEGARDVADFAVKADRGQRAFIRHLFHHIVKQSPMAYGADTLDRLHRSFVDSEFNIQKLIAEIALTAATHGTPAAAQSTQLANH